MPGGGLQPQSMSSNAAHGTAKFRERFGERTKVLFAVIHCNVGDEAHALEQTRRSVEGGAHGVFLIIMQQNDSIAANVIRLYDAVRAANPALFIGLSFLGLRPDKAMMAIPLSADALWTDEGVSFAGVNESLGRLQEARTERGYDGLLFGGFSFKGTRKIPTDQLSEFAPRALQHLDIPNTSGDGTGVAMEPGRAAAIRDALGDVVISIASGVTAENVEEYLPFIDAFMVGTGIETKVDPDNEEHQALVEKHYYAGLTAKELIEGFGVTSFMGEVDINRVRPLADAIRKVARE